MEITNSQPSFKAAIIQPSAERAMKKRMSSANFTKLKEDFINKYKDSKLDVEICSTAFESVRLDATVKCGKRFKRYIEEGVFSSIFRSPNNFIEKVNQIVDKDILPKIK